jgi:SAM-dependent methyltransferase
MDILLGCGHSRTRMVSPIRRDWVDLVTVDINPECEPDVEWDLNMIPLPFDDNSAEEIHAYNVLEHCGSQGDYKFFFKQFEDFWRVLKPGGFMCFTCPTGDNIWTWGDPGHTRVINNGSISFLEQRAYTECGRSARTDYRFCYKADFKVLASIVENDTFTFVLQAIKGAF